MIEGPDINDKEILDTSRKETNPNGTFRFKIDLPNGQTMHSEWLTPELGRKAVKLWCDAVRQAWPEAVREKAAEKGKAARRQALDKLLAEPPAPAADINQQAIDKLSRTVDKIEDPLHHAKNQVALLEAEERHWMSEFTRAQKHLDTTQRQLRKWKQIVASLDAGEEENGQS
jgi:hypothetical protein